MVDEGVVVYDQVWGRPLVWDGTALRLTTEQHPVGTSFRTHREARDRIDDSIAHYTARGLADWPERYTLTNPRLRKSRPAK